MNGYRRELVALSLLMLFALAGGGHLDFLEQWFAVDETAIGEQIAPGLAASSYLREGESAPNGESEAATVSNAVAAPLGLRLFKKVEPEPPPAIAARAALLADLETGETIYAVNPDMRWPTASLNKLMTAVYAAEFISERERVRLTTEIRSHIGDDAVSDLFPGEVYRADDLITAMLTFSSNEAAEALAERVGRDAFIRGMRERAAAWGLNDTVFADPTGLSAANQSTARDLRTLLLYLYRGYTDVLAKTRIPSGSFAELATGRTVEYRNINLLAGRKDFLGGKTGYTDEASGNLMSLFAYENRPIVIVVLGTDDRFGATEQLLDWFARTHTSR